MPTFLGFLGVVKITDMQDAPGQWTRLLKGYIKGLYKDEYIIDEQDQELEAGEGYTSKEGHATALIND